MKHCGGTFAGEGVRKANHSGLQHPWAEAEPVFNPAAVDPVAPNLQNIAVSPAKEKKALGVDAEQVLRPDTALPVVWVHKKGILLSI